jgi:hypothetical protein
MSSQHLAVMRIVLFTQLLWLAPVAVAVEVDANELAHCAGLAAIETRVACYDAIARSALPRAGLAAPAAAVAAQAALEKAAPAATPPAAGSADPNDPAKFGLTQRQLKTPEGPSSIKAIVSQITEDRLNNVSLVLENGQTWTFIEPDPRVRPGDTVTIKRAALGSFLMITPSRRSYRVERQN